MIKLLNVISGLNNAGTEAVVMNYYRNMDRSEIQFDFLVLNEGEGYYEKEIESLGGKIYKIPSFLSDPLRNISLRKKFFKEHKYDIVEVHSPSVLRYGYCQLAKKSGAKVIFHLHNSEKVNVLLRKYAYDKIKKNCDEIVTCSQYAAINALGDNCVKVVKNAIQYEKFAFDAKVRQSIRSELGFKEEDIIVGYVARLTKVKNQMFLIQMINELSRINKEYKLVLKGFGEDEKAIKDYIENNLLQNEIILINEKYDAAELYNAFDVFCFPSLMEGLGIVALEAQLNGLYVIASNNVPDEIKVTDRVKKLDLDPKLWISELKDKQEWNRVGISLKDWQKTGYEIKSAAAQRLNDYKILLAK